MKNRNCFADSKEGAAYAAIAVDYCYQSGAAKGDFVLHSRGKMRPKYSNNPAAVLAYAEERLSRRNDCNGIIGGSVWFGVGAERLDLRGTMAMEAVEAFGGNCPSGTGWTLVLPEWEADASGGGVWGGSQALSSLFELN